MTGTATFDALRPASGTLRMVRSAAVGAVCTLTAAAGHGVAGGRIPATSVCVVVAAATAVAWGLAARRVTPGQMVGLLVLCQVGVHLSGSMDSMHMGPMMLAMHAVATAVSATLLTRGEAFVWHVAERLGLRVSPNGLRVVTIPSWEPAVAVVATRRLHDVRLAHSHWLRGPPSGP